MWILSIFSHFPNMKYTFLGAVIVLFVSLFASSVLALEVTSS